MHFQHGCKRSKGAKKKKKKKKKPQPALCSETAEISSLNFENCILFWVLAGKKSELNIYWYY